jgi:hypothetical protein
MIKYLLTILTVILLVACSKSTDNNEKLIEDFLVRSNEITGWTFSGSGWTANSISELTGYIDGEADIYQRYGFIEAAYQQYGGTVNSQSATLAIYIYNLGSAANALSTYNDPGLEMNGAIDWTGGAGDKSHYARNSGLSQTLSFIRKNYFVKLQIDADTDESLNVIKQFALNIDSKMK